MKLTSEQITQFQVSGYVYLGEILNAKELKVAREANHRVFDSKPSSYRDIGLEDSETGQQKAVLQQVLNVYELEDIFRQTEFRSDVVDAVEALLGTSSIRLYGDQALWKPAKHGSRVLWHHDCGTMTMSTGN